MIAAALALSSALVPHAGLRLDLAPAASRADVSMNFFKNLAAATAPDRGVGAEGGKQLKKVRPEPPLRRPNRSRARRRQNLTLASAPPALAATSPPLIAPPARPLAQVSRTVNGKKSPAGAVDYTRATRGYNTAVMNPTAMQTPGKAKPLSPGSNFANQGS